MSSWEAPESLVCVSLCVTFPSKRIPHLPFQSISSTIFSAWDAFPKTIVANQLAMDNCITTNKFAMLLCNYGSGKHAPGQLDNKRKKKKKRKSISEPSSQLSQVSGMPCTMDLLFSLSLIVLGCAGTVQWTLCKKKICIWVSVPHPILSCSEVRKHRGMEDKYLSF